MKQHVREFSILRDVKSIAEEIRVISCEASETYRTFAGHQQPKMSGKE